MRTLWNIGKALIPAAAGLGVGGPIGAVITVAGQVSGALEKKRGKAKEADGAKPVHKATAPAAAVAGSSLIALVLRLFGIEGADDLAGVACGSPEGAAASLGALSVFVHQLTSGAEKAVKGRS